MSSEKKLPQFDDTLMRTFLGLEEKDEAFISRRLGMIHTLHVNKKLKDHEYEKLGVTKEELDKLTEEFFKNKPRQDNSLSG